jgi:hypothetical protein
MHFGFMNLILLCSDHQRVSATTWNSSKYFMMQTISLLTKVDRNSPRIPSMYITPQTTIFNF